MTISTMRGFKGFDKDMRCRGVQYFAGKIEVFDGTPQLCERGLHFCADPLDVLAYYAPNTSRYAEISAEDVSEDTAHDSKRVARTLKIDAEISLSHLITAGLNFRLRRYDFANAPDRSTGERGAASATGVRGAASATGERGAASATGWKGAASATGESGAASATGWRGAASATGERGCAIALGRYGQALGAVGCWLTLAEWAHTDDGWRRIDVQTAQVDGVAIKANVFYKLSGGKFMEAE